MSKPTKPKKSLELLLSKLLNLLLFFLYAPMLWLMLKYNTLFGAGTMILGMSTVYLMMNRKRMKDFATIRQIPYLVFILLSCLALLAEKELILKLQPAFVHFMLAGVFGMSIFMPPNVFERILTAVRPKQKPNKAYCLRLTRLSVGGLVFFGSFSIYTAFELVTWKWAVWNALSLPILSLFLLTWDRFFLHSRLHNKSKSTSADKSDDSKK